MGFVGKLEEIRARARQHIEDGAVTKDYPLDRDQVISVLNEALATEIICVLHYQFQYFMATGIRGRYRTHLAWLAARILGDACIKIREYSVEGITLDRDRIEKFVNESLMLVTALSPVIGYDKASAIAHRALDQNTTLRDAAVNGGFVSAEEFDRIVYPKKMVGNPRRDLGMA